MVQGKMNKIEEIDKEKLLESLKKYAQKKHICDIEDILLSNDYTQHYTVSVNAMSILEFSIEFAHFLFRKPEYALDVLNKAFRETSIDVFNSHDHKEKLCMKEHIHTRLTTLPACPEIYRTVLPRCNDVGQFLCISGTVIRATVTKMLEYRKRWRCTKCKYEFIMDVEVEQGFEVVKPITCRSPEWCPSKNFSLVSNGINPAWCKDYQEVKVQEQVHNLVVGTVPRSMWVVLTDNLVDSCQPGNDVIISGVLHTRWQPLVQGVRSDIELVLVAHNVEVKNNNIALGAVSEIFLQEFKQFWQVHCTRPLEGRDFILSCLCPQVFGLYIVKLAVALVLAGGVQRTDTNGKIRGDSHLLLVGDPGTGKSQFLKYASKISRRSVLTSGVGTTNAGLTAAAVKDGAKWQLEAGALVLADGGICCIDEFSSIKEQDKASIHEAMEQQTVSVAKAGLVCKLSTQCSILAATNPKGKYNKNESLSVNTAMASPLLSRFDVILVLLDTYSTSWDELVSSYILENKDILSTNRSSCTWSMEKMRAYFSAIKNINPELTRESDRILQAYYQKQRSCEDRNAARTTPRMLQSLLRLAQGHARLMFRDKVLTLDAIMAIFVMESSMVGCGLFSSNDALHTTFPDDPQAQYDKQCRAILTKLGLEDTIKKSLPLLSSEDSIQIRETPFQREPVNSNGQKLDESFTTEIQNVSQQLNKRKHAGHNLLSSSSPSNSQSLNDINTGMVNRQRTQHAPLSKYFEPLENNVNTEDSSATELVHQRSTSHAKTVNLCATEKRSCELDSLTKSKRIKPAVKNLDVTDDDIYSSLINAADCNIRPGGSFPKTFARVQSKTQKRPDVSKVSSSAIVRRMKQKNQSGNSNDQTNQFDQIRNTKSSNVSQQCLSNNVSTISELNAIFCAELLNDNLGDASDENSDISSSFEIFKKFAFKSKRNSQSSI